jgi:ketosteroid isomerase-like protein
MRHDLCSGSRRSQDWATAVHAGDLDGVLADPSEDIQVFDVPKGSSPWPS